MKSLYKTAIVLTWVALWSTTFTVCGAAWAQDTSADEETDAAARARRAAEKFEADARILTVFDGHGNIVTTIGKPGLFRFPALSPDGSRLAVVERDPESRISDLWVFEVATGTRTRITSNLSSTEERTALPVWSPDGTQLVYMSFRDSYEGVYRKSANGEGPEELLYRHPGSDVWVSDWSLDGRYLSFATRDIFGGIFYVLPMKGNGERQPIKLFQAESRSETPLSPSLSPDARFLTYASDESGRPELHVRALDPMFNGQVPAATETRQVSLKSAKFALRQGWRRDAGEFYYVAANGGVMAVQVHDGSTLEFGEPRQLFRLSEAVDLDAGNISASRDGDRFVIAVPARPTLQQITMLDRKGTVMTEVGEPGRYFTPALSPDGKKVAVRRIFPETGNEDIWTFEVASGVGTAVTNDVPFDRDPIWSPDSSSVAYHSRRGIYSSIYRKAWNGTGQVEQLFQYTPGAYLQPADWSADGRFVTFQDGCWGVLYVVPVGEGRDSAEAHVMEWLRGDYMVAQARFSPDAHFIAYLSDEIEADVFEVYIAPFDPGQPDGGRAMAKPVKVSGKGALGMISWRRDGQELYYMTPDWEMMVVELITTPTVQVGEPRLLFRLPGPLKVPDGNSPARWKNVSPDGERFVFLLDVPVTDITK